MILPVDSTIVPNLWQTISSVIFDLRFFLIAIIGIELFFYLANFLIKILIKEKDDNAKYRDLILALGGEKAPRYVDRSTRKAIDLYLRKKEILKGKDELSLTTI